MRIVSFFQIPPSVKYDSARPGLLESGPPPSPSPAHLVVAAAAATTIAAATGYDAADGTGFAPFQQELQ